jgi:hypothetical protein
LNLKVRRKKRAEFGILRRSFDKNYISQTDAMTLAFRQPRSLPISRDEFARLFRGASPSVGWSKKIGA